MKLTMLASKATLPHLYKRTYWNEEADHILLTDFNMSSNNTLTTAIPILDGANYQDWASQMEAYLQSMGLWRTVQCHLDGIGWCLWHHRIVCHLWGLPGHDPVQDQWWPASRSG